MSNELGFRNVNETDTLYVILRSSGDRSKVWDMSTSALVTAAAADWDLYDIPMVTAGSLDAVAVGTYYYVADFPSAAPAGTYLAEVFLQAGGTAAATDVVVGSFSYVEVDTPPSAGAVVGAATGQAVGTGIATLKVRLMRQFTGRVKNQAALGQTVEDAITDAHREIYAMGVPSAERVVDLTAIHASGTCTAGAYDAGNDKTTLTATASVFLATHEGYNVVIEDVGTFYIEDYTSGTEVDVTGDASAASADTFLVTPGYIRLPDGYGGIVRTPKKGLYIEDDETSRIEWADPLEWADLETEYGTDSGDEGTPKRWTIRYRNLNDIPIAVAEFLPCPDSAIVVKGLAMSAGAADMTFGTAGSSDDYSYLPRHFDLLLIATARRVLVCESGLTPPADPIVAAQEMRESRYAWERAYVAAQTLLEEMKESLEDERVDTMELAQQLQSAQGGVSDEILLARLVARD